MDYLLISSNFPVVFLDGISYEENSSEKICFVDYGFFFEVHVVFVLTALHPHAHTASRTLHFNFILIWIFPRLKNHSVFVVDQFLFESLLFGNHFRNVFHAFREFADVDFDLDNLLVKQASFVILCRTQQRNDHE